MRHVAAIALFCLVASHSRPAFAQDADGPDPAGADDAGTPPAGVPSTIDTSQDKPFARLFPHLFSDLKRYPSASTGLTLAIGGALSLATLPMDDYVTDHASAGGTDQMFAAAGVVGGGYVQAGGAVVTYVIGRLAGSPRVSHIGADLIRAQALNGLLTHATKMAVQRSRPGNAPGHVPATYSFPSAHASSTWTSATVLWRHLGWKAGVPATLVATFVSGARIQQKQHFLSDVTFGAAMGIASGRTITIGHGGRSLVAAPLLTPGGAGVVFTLAER